MSFSPPIAIAAIGVDGGASLPSAAGSLPAAPAPAAEVNWVDTVKQVLAPAFGPESSVSTALESAAGQGLRFIAPPPAAAPTQIGPANVARAIADFRVAADHAAALGLATALPQAAISSVKRVQQGQ